MSGKSRDLAVNTKLLSFLFVFIISLLIVDYRYSGMLSIIGFIYLLTQKKYSLLASFGIFYTLLFGLLIGIRFYSLKITILPEFYLLLLWNLLPIMILAWDLITTPPGEISAFLSRMKTPLFVILGFLVVFRFFPTMKSEMSRISKSMKNRGLLDIDQIIRHPIYTFEYALVPLLIRSIQISEQLSISAITRGALSANIRSSYYEKKMKALDFVWICIWLVVLSASIFIRIVKI